MTDGAKVTLNNFFIVAVVVVGIDVEKKGMKNERYVVFQS